MKKTFGVVEKRQDKEEIVDFKKFDIEELLLNLGVEFRNPAKAPGGWLPLEAFDNKELDTRAPKDWMIVKRDIGKLGSSANLDQNDNTESQPRLVRTEIPARGLWKDKDGLCFWRKLKIQKYLL